MMRIKTDKLSGKDKARYLKSLKKQEKTSADVPAVRSNIQQGGFAPVATSEKKKLKQITTTQLASIGKFGVVGSSTQQFAGDSGLTNSSIYTKAIDEQTSKDEEIIESIESFNGKETLLPAGFFDDGVEANATSGPQPSNVTKASQLPKTSEDDLDTFMNEIDNIPVDDIAEEEDAQSEEEEAVQLAYETKIARLLQKRSNPLTGDHDSKSDVFEEMDSVLTSYTSSVPSSSLGNEVSSFASSTIARDVQAALLRTKMKKRRHEEIATSASDVYSPLDLLDWTAKHTK